MKFILILIPLFLIIVNPVLAQNTQPWGSRCVKTVTVGGNTYNDIPTIQGFECLFYNILQIIITLAGFVFLFMFISGGFKYLFSGSEQKAVASASSTLTTAIIGLIGIIASWFILKFIQDFTGINITIFKIPG